MSGVSISLTTIGLDAAIDKLARLNAFEMAQLADNAGALLESSTRRRIGEEKTSPGGEAWADWSEEYAATRGGQHSLLVGENNLLESIQSFSTGSEAIVGTNLVYGAVHNFGGDEAGSNIPQREFLGLSDEDVRDLHDLVTTSLGGLLQ